MTEAPPAEPTLRGPDPESKEIPELLQSHFDHLAGSAIDVVVMRERGYRTILGPVPLEEIGFAKNQRRPPGILIPLHGVDGQVVGYQYRPDHPREDKERKRKIKYENPAGASIRIDVPPRCLEDIKNPHVPLWITEGVKKVDSLASHGACAIGLTGVWGFRGKNKHGGMTNLDDWGYIAFKPDRLVYLAFDSDWRANVMVSNALDALSVLIKRKGGQVRIINIPSLPDGTKVGVDDYLAGGHTLDQLIAQEDVTGMFDTLRHRTANAPEQYCIEDGRICYIKPTMKGPETIALCNFNARVIEDLLEDNGRDQNRYFKVLGHLYNGQPLPPVKIPANTFTALNWITPEWGMKAVLSAGATSKDKLREAIQIQSENAQPRTIYKHTGWRMVETNRIYMTNGSAIGADNIDVELDSQLSRYHVPKPEGSPLETVKASLAMLDIGNLSGTLPIWSAMYLAPLSEILDPAFTLWYSGPSGTMKSTLTALALCHFGSFTDKRLPASWIDTANMLEKLCFLAKDVPLVIDDWAPGQDSSAQRLLEVKAEYVVRAQGNRHGKSRMQKDTSSQVSYFPRGVLITSGEQIPSGQSHNARIFPVPLEKSDIERGKLSAAQEQSPMYSRAMGHYINWLRGRYEQLQRELPPQWRQWRSEVQLNNSRHLRLHEAIAWLYAGLAIGLTFAMEVGAIEEAAAKDLRQQGLSLFIEMADRQSETVDLERPGIRFMDTLRSLYGQGKVRVLSTESTESPLPAAGTTNIGWFNEQYFFLNKKATYGVVHDFCARSGEAMTFKEAAVFKDMARLNYIETRGDSIDQVKWICGMSQRVVVMKRSVLIGNPEE